MNDKKINFVISPKGYGKCYKEYKEVIDYLKKQINALYGKSVTNMIKNEKLQSNWNSLREWVQKHYDEYKDMEQEAMFEFGLMLDKMNELEGKTNDN